jgi:hypothetical protein
MSFTNGRSFPNPLRLMWRLLPGGHPQPSPLRFAPGPHRGGATISALTRSVASGVGCGVCSSQTETQTPPAISRPKSCQRRR